MGTSFVELRGKGFWTRDGKLELWLYLLATEIDRQADTPSWLRDLGEHWREQATAGYVGCIWAGLDDFVTDDQRRDSLLAVAANALRALDRYGDRISPEELNAMNTGGTGSRFLGDLPTEELRALGRAFIRLLRGEVETWAGSDPVPVV